MTVRSFSTEFLSLWPVLDRLAAPLEYEWNNGSTNPLPFLRRTLDTLRAPVVVRSTTACGSLSITYAGLYDGVRHGLTFLEDQCARITSQPVQRSLRRSSWREVRTFACNRSAECDLLVIGAPRQWMQPLIGKRDLVAPMRIHYVVELGRDREPARRRTSREVGRRFRKRERERNWNLEVCTDELAFWEFYERMHLPTMRRRHGENTRAESTRVAYYSLFRRGIVCFVREGSRRVAGAVCRVEDGRNQLLMRSVGVLEGEDKHYESGVFTGLIILILEWAQQNDFRSVELSGSEPFVNKGLYQFKRKFDPTIVVPNTHYQEKRLWLLPQGNGDLFRNFLMRNPVICQTVQGDLEVVFFGDDGDGGTKRVGWTTANLTKSRVVSLDELLTLSRPFTPT